MAQMTLKAGETKILVEAAAHGGRLTFPNRLKEATRQRMAELFAQHALTEAVGDELHLTRAGYRAVGLRPPRTRPGASGSDATRVSTRTCVRSLLGREEGATLAELMEATGWLPHTTRAALSRLRSGGHTLAKTRRDDGVTCYRLLPVAAMAPIRIARDPRTEVGAEVAA